MVGSLIVCDGIDVDTIGPGIVATVRALLVMSITYIGHLLINVPGTVQLNFAATIL